MKTYMDFAHAGSGVEECCLVLDVSPSMDYTDLKPSRLAAAVEASKALIVMKCEQHPSDRVAIVSFSASASLVKDMGTVTNSEIVRALETLRTSSSTNIGAGLEAARSVFARKTFGHPMQQFAQWVARTAAEPLPGSGGLGGAAMQRVILLSDGKHNRGARSMKTLRFTGEIRWVCVPTTKPVAPTALAVEHR